jgi:acetyl-CoA synthetase
MREPAPQQQRDEEARRRWTAVAGQLRWDVPFERLLEERPHGHPRWFPGGRLNFAVNTVHRHVEDRPDDVALHWEGEPGDRREITYADLDHEVRLLADALAGLGVRQGDRVALYLGLIPEAVVAMLACARLGAVHAALPAALPPDALSERLCDLGPRVLITQDGAWRHGMVLPLKSRSDEALTAAASVEQTIVVRRAGIDVPWFEGDRWYHELVATRRPGNEVTQAPPASVDADAPLLVTYVANRRGRPTGVVHGTGGLLAYSLELHRTFAPDQAAVLWTPAELGWIACQTHGIFGPLAAGGTAVIYEGMLDTPSHGRAWEIIERYAVTSLLATPSVVRALRRWVDDAPRREQVASLSLVVTAGEPIDADTEGWLRRELGDDETVVVNGWGQTELGAVVALQPEPPGPGIPDAGLEVVDAAGRTLPPGRVGDLVLSQPWPGTALGILGEPEQVPGVDPARAGLYVTGDRARRGADGTIEFLGRSDRVFSVSGQLVSAAEVRGVLEEHPFVARAEALDRPDQRTGRAVVACVELVDDAPPSEDLATDLRLHVHEVLGGLAQPQAVVFVEALDLGLDGEVLLRALQAVCTGSAAVQHVTRAQLRAAADSVGDGG